jgi:hypothetical protein
VKDVEQREARRQMEAILEAAERACKGDAGDMLAALIGAVGTFCARHVGAVQMLDIAIDAMTLAREELKTGLPMLSTEEPS